MTHIGDSLSAGDADRFSDWPGQAVQPALTADETTRDKALLVMRVFEEAGLRPAYGFPGIDAALDLWAVQLAGFGADVLAEAAAEWVQSGSREWPSVGEVANLARGVELARAETQRIEEARTRGECVTCEGVHWVRVVDSTERVETGASKRKRRKDPGLDPELVDVESSHLAPCPHCPEMAARRELYDRGHFDPEHQDAGGCPQCWPYMPSMAHRLRAWSRSAERREAS
jgi:hypothetical protein